MKTRRRNGAQFKQATAPSRVFTARIPVAEVKELEQIYPQATPNQIIQNLVHEKLARKYFDQWLKSLTRAFKKEDFDLGSI